MHDERIDAFRMRQRHSKSNRSAVVLHVQGVMRKTEGFRKVIHDLGVVIKRVHEFPWIRPIAVTEAGIIGRDEVIAIRKPSEEWLEHPRGGGKSVQQKKDRRVFRTGLSIEDVEAIDLRRAIERRML